MPFYGVTRTTITRLKKKHLYSNVNFHDKYKTEEVLHKNIIIDVKKNEYLVQLLSSLERLIESSEICIMINS